MQVSTRRGPRLRAPVERVGHVLGRQRIRAGRHGTRRIATRWRPLRRWWVSRTRWLFRAGGFTACALLVDGTVKCWGDNTAGALGNGNVRDELACPRRGHRSDERDGDLRGVLFVLRLARGRHRVVLGRNDYGQVGNGTTSTAAVSTPVQVSGLATVRSVSVGDNCACAVLASGSAYCWGYNNEGQLGDGTTMNAPRRPCRCRACRTCCRSSLATSTRARRSAMAATRAGATTSTDSSATGRRRTRSCPSRSSRNEIRARQHRSRIRRARKVLALLGDRTSQLWLMDAGELRDARLEGETTWDANRMSWVAPLPAANDTDAAERAFHSPRLAGILRRRLFLRLRRELEGVRDRLQERLSVVAYRN